LGRKRSLQASCLELLLSLFIEYRDFEHEGPGHPILLAAMTVETNEREEIGRLAVLGLQFVKPVSRCTQIAEKQIQTARKCT